MNLFVSGLIFIALLILPLQGGQAETPQEKGKRHFTEHEGPTPIVPREKIKVELFMLKGTKKEAKFIKELLAEQKIKRVLIQHFRAGNPPKNIVIGSGIPADVGRMMIELAIAFNNGITHLLPEARFFPHYVAFGSSAFDIQAQIPITAEDLDRLRDESLSTEDFHTLFRSLTGEDEGVLSYID
jgi:hypothetical protein